jgi:hypothetical protein
VAVKGKLRNPVKRTEDLLPTAIMTKLRMVLMNHLQREGKKSSWTQEERCCSIPLKR